MRRVVVASAESAPEGANLAMAEQHSLQQRDCLLQQIPSLRRRPTGLLSPSQRHTALRESGGQQAAGEPHQRPPVADAAAVVEGRQLRDQRGRPCRPGPRLSGPCCIQPRASALRRRVRRAHELSSDSAALNMLAAVPLSKWTCSDSQSQKERSMQTNNRRNFSEDLVVCVRAQVKPVVHLLGGGHPSDGATFAVAAFSSTHVTNEFK